MTRYRYPTVIAAALAMAFIGAAAAQTQSNDTSRMPASKGMPKAEQAQPANDQGSKVQGQSQSTGQTNEDHAQKNAANDKQNNAANGANESKPMHKAQKEHMKNSTAMGSKMNGHDQAMGSHTSTRHAGKSKRQSEEAMAPDEKAYRQALRGCAEEQNSSQRDSCLDNAIERFHKNA